MELQEKLNIGICDDEKIWRDCIISHCQKIQEKELYNIDVSTYQSAIDFLQDKDKEIDLLFLDVEMDGMNGITLMNQLIEQDRVRNIVFISSHTDYVWNAFSQKTRGYERKPVSYDAVIKYIKLISQEKTKTQYMEFREVEKTYYIKKNELLYIEAESNYMKVVTKSGSYLITSTLKACEERYADWPLLRVHRSFLVNMDQIKSLDHEITLHESTEQIQISRRYKKQVRDTYDKYLLEKVMKSHE